MRQSVSDRVQLMHGAFNAIEHSIQSVSQLAYLIVTLCCRHPLAQVRMADSGSRFSDFADMAQHALCDKENNTKPQEYD
jgi:hypothetical protein